VQMSVVRIGMMVRAVGELAESSDADVPLLISIASGGMPTN